MDYIERLAMRRLLLGSRLLLATTGGVIASLLLGAIS